MTTLVDCPQSDRGQWSFRLFGTPVRVKFWFWITLLIIVVVMGVIQGACAYLVLLERKIAADSRDYRYVSVAFDRERRIATIVLRGPDRPPPPSVDEMMRQGAAFWPLQLARELDDAILDIRFNEFDVAAIVFKSEGDIYSVLDYDAFLDTHVQHWLAHAVRLKYFEAT